MFLSSSCSWLDASVLGPHAEAYAKGLWEHGYSDGSIRAYLRSVGHFARWLTEHRISLGRIDEALATRFVTEHLPRCRCPKPCRRSPNDVSAALNHLLCVLRTAGQIPDRLAAVPVAIQEELDRYDAFLDEVCGLTASTRTSRRGWIRGFLLRRFGCRPIVFSALKPRDLHNFMAQRLEDCAPGTGHLLGCALRSYLRFRAFGGDWTEPMVAAIPTAAQWPQATLPRFLTADELTRFLGAFDRATTTGQRGYAMARCLVDLGLRASEVAGIVLEDLNWHEGTLRLRGAKGRRVDELPLPVTTGQAIVQYMRESRPKTSSRALFVRHRAPLDAPVTPAIVRCAVRLAYERCGLDARYSGTHVLRHTTATRLLASGSSLKEIADILRHRSPDTTTIYAKVDLAKLAAIAAPWPGNTL